MRLNTCAKPLNYHRTKRTPGAHWVWPTIAGETPRKPGRLWKKAVALTPKTGIRYVKQHAVEYKIDPDRIGLTGASAGGHLATLAPALAEVRPEVRLAQNGSVASGSFRHENPGKSRRRRRALPDADERLSVQPDDVEGSGAGGFCGRADAAVIRRAPADFVRMA